MLNIKLVLCALLALLVPSVALAADEAGAVPDAALQVAGVSAILLSVALAATRFVRVLEPLHDWLPSKAQWVPAALVAAAGVLTARLPAAQDWVTFSEVVGEAAVLVVLAAAAGIRDPEVVPSRAQKRARSMAARASAGLLVVLLALIGMTGCSWLTKNQGEIADASAAVNSAAGNAWIVCGEVENVRDRETCFAIARLVALGNAEALDALEKVLAEYEQSFPTREACPVLGPPAPAAPEPKPAE